MRENMKKAIYAAVAALLVAGCGKDKDLSPSGLDRNWFAVEDSSDPVDHLRYEIYSQTGIALFRNDTIGSIAGSTRWAIPTSTTRCWT